MEVSVSDWIALVVGALGLLAAWLARSNRLPANVRGYINKIGTEDVLKKIQVAAADLAASPEQRRMKVVEMVSDLAEKKLGFPVPDSIINLIVEYVYQLYKKGRRAI